MSGNTRNTPRAARELLNKGSIGSEAELLQAFHARAKLLRRWPQQGSKEDCDLR